ncbi:hypothetical protein KO116_00535 [Halomonas sp. KO116]|nr:hypothetical protein KO116_00535 [Halomonas sp. KO116]
MHRRTVFAIQPAPLSCILGMHLLTDLPDSDSHLPRATLYRLETSFLVAATPSNVAGR